MSGVDPKELAQRNIPLIVLYLVALAALPAWLVVVQGGVVGDSRAKNTVNHALKQLTTKKRTIKGLAGRVTANDPNDPVYNENFTKYFNERADKLATQTKELGTYLREKDAKLETWFDQFASLEQPDFNNFKQYWNSQALPGLAEEYKAIVTDPTDPESTLLHDDEPTSPEKMRFSMKRYWAQKYLLTAIKTGGQHGVVAPGSEERVPARLQDRILITEPRTRDSGGKEKPLVETFRVNLKFLCSFRDVSRILREVVVQPVPMRIQAFEVTKAPFRIEDRSINLLIDGSEKYFAENHTQILLKKIDDDFKGEDKLEEYVPEPPVLMTLEVDVLDFNPPEPKPAAPAEGEGDPEDK